MITEKSDIQEIKKSMEKYSKKVTASSKASKEFLVKTGIFDKDGTLQKPYKKLCIPEKQN